VASRRKPVRRFSSRRRHLLTVAVILVAALLLRLADRFLPPGFPEQLDPGPYRVERVIDGDTLLLTGGGRVRLIGADTPEAFVSDGKPEPFAEQATRYTRQFVAEGRNKVHLQFDGPRKDRYGRFLATVWVDGRMLNEELLRAGLARLRGEFPFSPPLKARLRRAEEEARAAQRGLHGPMPQPSATARGDPPGADR
jgi:micrococcal nuclease